MRTLATTSLLFCLFVLVAACSGEDLDGACTLIGCVDGLSVDLVPGQGWPAGHYTFSIEADGATQSCEGDLPLPPCENGGSITCQGSALASIGESGCALAPSEHGFSSIAFEGMPAHVVVQIDHDGTMIANRDLSPMYVTSQPNGPDCGPTCHSATAQVSVTF